VGLDFTVLKNISGTIDYYNKRSTDVLGSLDIDPFRGFSPTLVNQASINNRGWEITLNSDWISTRKVNWNTGLAFSHNKSKVLEAYVLKPALGAYTPFVSSQAIVTAAQAGYIKGEPVGVVYSYRYAGIDETGRALMYDSKGNITVMHPSYDEGIASLDNRGPSIPSTIIGLSNRLDIGNFYFYCMINFYGGFVVKAPRPDPNAVRPIAGAGNFWKKAGDEAIPGVLPSRDYIGTSSPFLLDNSDRFIMNGTYFTINDITASYNLRNLDFLQKAGFTSFEVKLQVSNLYTKAFNDENYSVATGNYLKRYMTPTYTIGIFTNF